MPSKTLEIYYLSRHQFSPYCFSLSTKINYNRKKVTRSLSAGSSRVQNYKVISSFVTPFLLVVMSQTLFVMMQY